MALEFICSNCDEKYPAHLSINKELVVAGETMRRESDPCPNCRRIADDAAKEALAKRRKQDKHSVI